MIHYSKLILFSHKPRLVVILVALQKVDQETIDELKQIFHSLDKNGNGILDRGDLVDWDAETMRKMTNRIVQRQNFCEYCKRDDNNEVSTRRNGTNAVTS